MTAIKTYRMRMRIVPWYAEAFDAEMITITATNAWDAEAEARRRMIEKYSARDAYAKTKRRI